MSVILRDPQGRIVLMCKGADSVIQERLGVHSSSSDVLRRTQEYVNLYAEEGLRTLFLAERFIDEATYERWNAEAQEARLEI